MRYRDAVNWSLNTNESSSSTSRPLGIYKDNIIDLQGGSTGHNSL